MKTPILKELSAFCTLANREIFHYYGDRGSCIFSTGVCCEVLTHFGFQAEPLRVEATLFHDDRKHHGCILGAIGDGTRRAAAGKDAWHGHLVSLVADRFLVDSTLDQANDDHPHLHAKPIVIDLMTTKWFDPDPPLCGDPWTGLLRPWGNGVQLRVTQHPKQVGWKHAGDFRPGRRRELVQRLIKKAAAIFVRPAD